MDTLLGQISRGYGSEERSLEGASPLPQERKELKEVGTRGGEKDALTPKSENEKETEQERGKPQSGGSPISGRPIFWPGKRCLFRLTRSLIQFWGEACLNRGRGGGAAFTPAGNWERSGRDKHVFKKV